LTVKLVVETERSSIGFPVVIDAEGGKVGNCDGSFETL
jgi:hypothetical protein